MASVTTPAQLDGLFKQIYADNIVNLIPDSARLVKDIKFVGADKETGDQYNQPVVLSNEHGVSFGAAGDGAFSLNSAIALSMKNASIQGSMQVLRSAISYDAASKASSSKKAFVRGTEFLIENMLESMTKSQEISLLYGGSGIGSASAVTGTTTSTETDRVITLSTASFAAGIWSGAENSIINFYTAGGALVSSSADANFTVAAVDIGARTIKLTHTAAGGQALKTAITSAAVNIFRQGSYGKEMTGLNEISSNTTGTIFGISATTFGAWAGNVHSAGSGALTMAKVLAGLAKAAQRGLNEDVTLYTNPATWANLNADQAALRSYDSSYKSSNADVGQQSITYYGQTGKIDIISHSLVKEGEAFAVPLSRCRRIGSSDITFKRPGRQGEDFFRELPDSAGYELRSYQDISLFCSSPNKLVKFSSIVNS